MKIEEQLLNKYNVPVPRYTSYPPANHFSEQIREEDFLSMVEASNNEKPEHLAFYIHIPYCKKICHYCGCNSCSLGSGSSVDQYIRSLKTEIEIVSNRIRKSRKVSQIHFGGGTPNAISLHYLKEIIELIKSRFELFADAEIAIECNPSFFDYKHLAQLKDSGFNRYSIGIQDFNNKVLKNVNRDPSAMPVEELINFLKDKAQGVAVNLDFIYGLPGQDVKSFSDTISRAASIRPDRLVTFSYAHVPWLKKAQKRLDKIGLPGPKEKIDMFLAGHDILTGAGYKHIGLDHYVLEDDELYLAMEQNLLHRNFQGYCTRRTTGQVYAFGVSSISQLESGYFQNIKSVNDYISVINSGRLPVEKGLILSDGEKGTREIITDLMCNKYLNWNSVSEKLGVSRAELSGFISFDPEEFRIFSEDGIVEVTNDSIKVSEKGSLFIRNIAASLDPAFGSQSKKYSKSV